MPVRTSALRTLGGQGNVFAIESFLDEIAAERGEDPVAFRLRHLKDERAKDVIRAAARLANWKPAGKAGIGYGVGFSRYKNTGAYCAAVAEIEGDEDIRVKKAEDRGRCRRGHQSRRRHQPDRGRRDPGHELGAEGARALRPRAHHQQ